MRTLVTSVPDMGYTLLTLKACLVAYRDSESVEQALRAVVEGGGDTDTNGAAVGAVAGAKFGLEGIPEDWRAHVREIRDGRIPMEAYADRLVEALYPESFDTAACNTRSAFFSTSTVFSRSRRPSLPD